MGLVLRSFRIGLAVTALLCVGVGVAEADPLDLSPVSSYAEPTADGWHLGVALTSMVINPVPNMAATAFTREGFLTATAVLTLDGEGANRPPVTGGGLSLFVLIGCQVDLTGGVQLGGDDQVGTVGALTANNGGVGASVDPFNRLNPQLQVMLKPGNIGENPLGQKALVPKYPETISDADKATSDPAELAEWASLEQGGSLSRVMQIKDSHVEVNGCGGPVFVRFRAMAAIKTGRDIMSKSSAQVDVYSDIVAL
jgi:hypothetical protein